MPTQKPQNVKEENILNTYFLANLYLLQGFHFLFVCAWKESTEPSFKLNRTKVHELKLGISSFELGIK